MNKHWKPAAGDSLWSLSMSCKCLPASEAWAKANTSGGDAEITTIYRESQSCGHGENKHGIHGPWSLAAIGRSPQHARQHVRNNRSRPGLSEREGVWQKDAVSVTHVGGFGSFLWKYYRQWQTLPLDAGSQFCFQTNLTCATWLSRLLPARGSQGAIQGGTGSKGGIRVFSMSIGSSLWGSSLQKYGERKLWGYFLLHSLLVDDPDLQLCTKEQGSLWEIPLHYTSCVQMHNIQSSICRDEGP